MESRLPLVVVMLLLGLMGACGGKESVSSSLFLGDEFIVNTFSQSHQTNPAIAMDANGNFVVVWASKGQDGGVYGIYGQRFNAAGEKQGGEFRVNTYTTNNQKDPDVAMDADGDFVVVWESWYQEDDGYEVYGQRYNALGVAQGSEFRVNTYTTSYQRDAAIAMDAEGNFVVAWLSWGQAGDDAYAYVARRFNAAGEVQGEEFLLTTNTLPINQIPGVEAAEDLEIQSEEEYLAVAMDADGDFVAAWVAGEEGDDGFGIYGRRFNASGVAQGDEFKVNTVASGDQSEVDVAMDANGDTVVVWHSEGEDGDGYAVMGRRYDADGVAQGAPFQVNTYTAGNQNYPVVSMDDDGDFVVVWESQHGQDGHESGVFAQRYSAAGVAQGEEIQVNVYTQDWQEENRVALQDDKFVVAWMSWGPDGDGDTISARLFD